MLSLGPFRPSSALFSGLLWKIPFRLSPPQKLRQRRRLRQTDRVVDIVHAALESAGLPPVAAAARWRAEMPAEPDMLPRDKYSVFDRKARGYRKGIHRVPKWTRVSQRVNPPGF